MWKSTHEPHLRAFYLRLVGRGLKKLQALCAVMRKLPTGLHAVLRDGKPFDVGHLFVQAKTAEASA